MSTLTKSDAINIHQKTERKTKLFLGLPNFSNKRFRLNGLHRYYLLLAFHIFVIAPSWKPEAALRLVLRHDILERQPVFPYETEGFFNVEEDNILYNNLK